jgi:hypothetical protein
MGKVCNQEALVKVAVALQADTFSPSAAQIVCVVCIDTDVRLIVYNAGKSHRGSLILADVLGKPLREAGIGLLNYGATLVQKCFVV